ncbi:SIR2 family NAD-dependent protein deacylase [Neobacillus jeddahensis]|uniref:SIR2 family NAD-dependent protein deacylase n=1 Tax=Neobacillus jeddahensis TaxID=1461580 RepID=UPI00058BCEBF|nr:SIR2 family protein [Neobacillus jeddahensis]
MFVAMDQLGILLKSGYKLVPLTIQEIIDTQGLLKGSNQVIHLHGHIKKRDSMVLSNRSYKDLYNDPAVRTLLSTIIGARPLLFMGFSFNDEFFKNIYNDLNSILRTSHYIVLSNPEHKDVRRFIEQNIRVIGVNVAVNSENRIDWNDYIIALRTLIRYITSM